VLAAVSKYPLALTWLAAIGVAVAVVEATPGQKELVTATTTLPGETIYVTIPSPEPREPPPPSPTPPAKPPAPPGAPHAPTEPSPPPSLPAPPVVAERPPEPPLPPKPPPRKPPRPGKSETGRGCEHAPPGKNKFCG
jgi:hypothetical protein